MPAEPHVATIIEYDIYLNHKPCVACGAYRFIDHPEVGPVCVSCVGACQDYLTAQEEDDMFEDAITLYCQFSLADKTPGN